MLSQLTVGEVLDGNVDGRGCIALHDVIAVGLETYEDLFVCLQDGQHCLAQLFRIRVCWEAQHPGDVVLRIVGMVDAVHIDARLRE